jgi:lycopene beta-cyclase
MTVNDGTHLIVGGGLAGGLAALALADAGRGPGVLLVERGAALAGNHTWSFHETDLGDEERALVMPLVSTRWPRQAVRFPGHARTLETGYATVTSERFARVVGERLERAGVRVLTERQVEHLDQHGARLDDGTTLTADVVLDARGPAPEAARTTSGFQKFVGLEVELAEDGPWGEPLVMDATVAQNDGFRFVYVLPFSRRRVLVEDTTYSDGPALDRDAFEARVHAYLEASGATVRTVLRREHGVLPLPLAGEASAPGPDAALAIGYRGGFFHPVTGYSLPVAARVARALAGVTTREDTRRALDGLARALEPQRRFERLLNRLMFSAMPAPSRWQALARFYQLPERTIARFYGSRSTLLDRARVLLGRPPRGVAWTRLLGAVAEGA